MTRHQIRPVAFSIIGLPAGILALLTGCLSTSQQNALKPEYALAAYKYYELDLKSANPIGRYFSANFLEENVDAILGPDPSTADLNVKSIRMALRFGDHISRTVRKTATCDQVNCFVLIKFFTRRNELSQYKLTYIQEPSSSKYGGLKISRTELTIY